MRYLISKSEKLFWVILFLFSFFLDQRFFILLLVILVIRFRASSIDTSTLGREVQRNFLYSPINGLVSKIEHNDDHALIRFKIMPVFGDLVCSPGEFLINEDPRNCDGLVFSMRGVKFSIGLEIKNGNLSIEPNTNLRKYDKIFIDSPLSETFLGGEIVLTIPKELSLKVKKNDLVWSGKTIICS